MSTQGDGDRVAGGPGLEPAISVGVSLIHTRETKIFYLYVSRATRVLSSVTFATPLGALKLGHPIGPCGERFGDVDAVLFGGAQPPWAIRG